MNALVWIDWLCLGLLIISVLLGLMRGLLSEALGLAGWLVALVAARQFGAEAGALLDEVILSPGIRTAVGFVLVVLGTVLVWGLMLRLLERLVQAVGMGASIACWGCLRRASGGGDPGAGDGCRRPDTSA
ncbi:CvpA family protein [Cobetia marina]